MVVYLLRKHWATELISRTLKHMSLNDLSRPVSHEAINNVPYIMPRGSLKKKLIARLRQATASEWSRGKDRHHQIPDLVSILCGHLRSKTD